MKLELEFIRRRRIPWAGLVFCVAAATWCVVLAVQWFQLHAAEQHGQERLAALERSWKDRQREFLLKQQNIDPMSLQRMKEQKKIIDALRYPWNRVLAPIENTEGKDVAILSLSHDQGSGNTQLQVEALNAEALVRFVDDLNEGNDDDGDHWYLASLQAQPQNNPPTVKGMIVTAAPVH